MKNGIWADYVKSVATQRACLQDLQRVHYRFSILCTRALIPYLSLSIYLSLSLSLSLSLFQSVWICSKLQPGMQNVRTWSVPRSSSSLDRALPILGIPWSNHIFVFIWDLYWQCAIQNGICMLLCISAGVIEGQAHVVNRMLWGYYDKFFFMLSNERPRLPLLQYVMISDAMGKEILPASDERTLTS